MVALALSSINSETLPVLTESPFSRLVRLYAHKNPAQTQLGSVKHTTGRKSPAKAARSGFCGAMCFSAVFCFYIYPKNSILQRVAFFRFRPLFARIFSEKSRHTTNRYPPYFLMNFFIAAVLLAPCRLFTRCCALLREIALLLHRLAFLIC